MPNLENIVISISYDQRMVADGLAAILTKQKDFEVGHLIKNELDSTDQLSVLKADLLILEFSEISTTRIDCIKKIIKTNPNLKLLIISGTVSRVILEELMHHVNGYLIRTCSAEKVILAISEIVETGKYLCPKTIQTLFEEDDKNQLPKSELTSREKEILSLWLISKDNTEIANKLNISQTTVRTHLKNIREKFGHANQIQMMIYACKENLLSGQFKPICPNCRSFCFPIAN